MLPGHGAYDGAPDEVVFQGGTEELGYGAAGGGRIFTSAVGCASDMHGLEAAKVGIGDGCGEQSAVYVGEVDGDAWACLITPAAPDTFADESWAAVDVSEGPMWTCGDTGAASMAEYWRDILETGHGYLLLMMISASNPSRAICSEKSINMTVVRSITLWNVRRL